jgi:hypothetical protein
MRAGARIVAPVAQKRKTSEWRDTAGDPVPLELLPERAFVLHLDTRAQPPRHVVGRIEHVTSGRVAHVASLRALVAFLADVLRDGSAGD